MPIFKNPKNNNSNQPDSQAINQSANSEPTNQQKGFINLPPIIGQVIPFLPMLFEQFTGQKVPQISGTIAEMQLALQQIQSSQQQLLANQKEIASRIENLENQATNQLTNLQSQFNAFRLLATKETKAIEFNSQPQIEDHV